MISLTWIFFKRGKEVLRVKLQDVYYDQKELMVTFRIEKKRKRFKLCPNCGTKNARKAKFCRSCSFDLSQAETIEEGREPQNITKIKSMEFPFCKYVVEWVNTLKSLNPPENSYLFPPFNYFAKTFQFNKHLTIQRFDQILQRLDQTLTSHMFRYGAAEKLLILGYTPYEIKEIGDWSSSRMPEEYAKRKGLTISQRKFIKDVRILGAS